MQWMIEERRLGTEQRIILDRCLRLKTGGRLWIQGVAGSGKTVALVHGVIQALKKNPALTVCVVAYTHSLKDLMASGLPDSLRNIPVMTLDGFLKNPQHYDLLFVDEVQDLERAKLETLNKYGMRLIVAGDCFQSIYPDRASSAEIEQILSPEKCDLVILYRITQTLKKIAETVLPNSNILAAKVDRLAANVQVILAHSRDKKSEISWVWEETRQYSKQGDPVAILLPNKNMIKRFIDTICELEGTVHPSFAKNKFDQIDYDQVNRHLENQKICLRYLGNNYGSSTESDERPIVYLMTYHSAKGLDFKNVFLPHLNAELEIWGKDEDLSRRLFYVAITRSRLNLFMSYHSDEPHRYVKLMPQNLLHKIEINERQSGSDNDIDNIF